MIAKISALTALFTVALTILFIFGNRDSMAFLMSFITGLLIVLGLFLNSRDQRTAATRSPLPSTQSELDKAQKQLGDLQNELSSLRSQALCNAAATHELEDAAVLMFVRVLQEKSRLLDFTLTDISRLPDNQVGAAARVVHQGLRSVLNDSFDISPIAAEAEGQTVVLPDNFDSSRFRVLRQKPGSEKPAGILLHRGWEALSIRLPRISHRPGEALPRVFAPAEIEAQEGV